MKRIVIAILSAVLMVSTFASCSSGNTKISEPSSSPVPEATAYPTASPTPDPLSKEHEYCDDFKVLLDDGAVIPDYETYKKPASENGKGETEIVMFGTFGELYEVNGYTVIDFFEGGENLYALSLGSPDKDITDLYTGFIGKDAEIYGLYLGYSDMLHAPTGFLYITYCEETLYTDSFAHIAGDGMTGYSGGNTAYEQESSENSSSREESSNIDTVTTSQSNALKKAKEYLSFMCFSREGLIDQLEYEEFSREDAVYAVDHCGADWNDQALGKAKEYLSFTSFSYSGLIDQLEYEGFTLDQATYGADNCKADWKEQAAKKAKEYLEFMSFSRGDLIDQLIYEGFTREQAEYGADQAGL